MGGMDRPRSHRRVRRHVACCMLLASEPRAVELSSLPPVCRPSCVNTPRRSLHLSRRAATGNQPVRPGYTVSVRRQRPCPAPRGSPVALLREPRWSSEREAGLLADLVPKDRHYRRALGALTLSVSAPSPSACIMSIPGARTLGTL